MATEPEAVLHGTREQIFRLIEQVLRLVRFTQQKPVHAVMRDAHHLRQPGGGA